MGFTNSLNREMFKKLWGPRELKCFYLDTDWVAIPLMEIESIGLEEDVEKYSPPC